MSEAVIRHLEDMRAALEVLDLERIGELVGLPEATRRGGEPVFTRGNGRHAWAPPAR